ncbi:MAG TPA: alpha-hydroxy acid oxidase, partial [Opitutaceae bacterium]|nr:alpha-hydroxy acid oxidase [Opitutaceae bacterium]
MGGDLTASGTAVLPPLAAIPREIACAGDYEALARERMSAQAWAYLSGGAGDEITLRRNREAFDAIPLRGRVLAELSGGDTGLELFGQAFDFPILLAPVAYLKLAHAEGEVAAALGAAAAEAGLVLSTHASAALEEVAAAAPSRRLWFQLYVQPDREFTAALVRRAEEAGYSALVVTLDAPVGGARNREQRAGFALPPGIEAVNTRGMPQVPAHRGRRGAPLCGGILEGAPTWKDVDWLRSLTRLPILLKGIMSPEDAARAVDAGASGLVVSNHGGRTLDRLPASIEVLPAIADGVKGRVPVLLDGGIRRGTDVLTALALGASAVLVGRPYVHGLAAAGAPGVAHVINLL